MAKMKSPSDILNKATGIALHKMALQKERLQRNKPQNPPRTTYKLGNILGDKLKSIKL